MRLRQKLFGAILAVMLVVFLLIALTSILDGLRAQRAVSDLRERLERGAGWHFLTAASHPTTDNWGRFRIVMRDLGFKREWCVRESETGNLVCSPDYLRGPEAPPPGRAETAGLASFAVENEFELLMPGPHANLGALAGLSGVFWGVAAGTVFLLLVVYGLLLRLVLRPIDNLVAASRALSQGARPAKVPGESRTDEMGELVRAFNAMAGDVHQSREELQKKVAEAVADYERAQKRLTLEQRLSATGKLAAGVAHEISNPLGGMINAARAIDKEEGLSERAREYVGLINDGLGRVRDIVERMRSFVRPKPAVGPVDVGEAVRGALAFARHRVKGEGVQLEEQYPDDTVNTVGDAGELQQVFLNLVMNALDAVRESGEKKVSVSVAREESCVIAEIADTGPGMDEERLAGAFDLFYSTKDEGGTGLGLAIAHRIVTDHGGEIELESSPDQGTLARVRLPPAH